jgi:lysophospholipase L1-like esterase
MIFMPRFLPLRIVPVIALLVTSVFANTAVEPVAGNASWLKRHEGFVDLARTGGVNVLFLGDSITDAWRTTGKALWEKEFAPLGAANFGIGGDRTQHVLWRLANGEADVIKPKVVILLIGTNNTGLERDNVTVRNTVPETIAGITAVVQSLRQRLPQAKILLLAVFPRSDGPGDVPVRAQVAEVNRAIANLHDGRSIHYLDIGAKFLAADGTLPAAIMPDKLHLSEAGYVIWADAIRAPLAALLK